MFHSFVRCLWLYHLCQPALGLDSLEGCSSYDEECYAKVADDPYEGDLFLLQHAAVAAVAPVDDSARVPVVPADAPSDQAKDETKESKRSGARILDPELGPLERILRVLSSLRDRLTRWGWGGSSKPQTPEEKCTSGLFVKYSDVKLEQNLEASFTLNSPGVECSSSSEYGPNECCVQFGAPVNVTVHAALPTALTAEAVINTRISGWYGWIPLRDSFSCKLCGEPCNACPSISQYLPSLFPCEPRQMPDCPIPAGSVTDKASAKLPDSVQNAIKGCQATVTYSIVRADGSTATSGEIFGKASR